MDFDNCAEIKANLIEKPDSSFGRTAENEGQEKVSPEWLAGIAKIDAHVHLNGDEGVEPLFEKLETENMKWLAICYDGLNLPEMESRKNIAEKFHERIPERISWITSFQLADWNSPDWQKKVIDSLEESFEQGAVAVKVWKDIGMALKDPDNSLVMIDDPRFDPVFDYIRSRDKTLTGHVIEPKSCWLALEEMALNNDRDYYSHHPEEHAYKNRDIPRYDKYIDALKGLLERQPDLRIVICHLAGLESDVEALGELLDKHPNFAVDTAARIGHLQALDRDKVRAFLIKYQDRVLYGTDLETSSQDRTVSREFVKQAAQTWERDRVYFSTDKEISVPELDCPVRGLALPAQVLRNIYYENARRWYPGV
jgi:Amidohydrolase